MHHSSQAGNRAAELTGALTNAPKADDHDGVRDYLHALAGLGCAPLLVYPASKKPADVRTPQKRRAEDKAAREAAQAAGHPRPRSVRSQAGVHLATADTGALDAYLDRYVATFGDAVKVNVAVSLGRSRLVVVDCDTAAQLAAFLTDAGADPGTVPTVRTPGQFGPDGVTLVHCEGGHYYFTVPEGVELPPGPPGSMKVGGDDGYSIMWGVGNYVLTPPSVRAEGAYTATGEPVYELPAWLAETIAAHGRSYAEAAQLGQARADAADDPVARWGAGMPWSAILEPAGWTLVGKADGCGCPVWTAPGVHGSPKSATAHEPGCARRADSADPPLHIWTDSPGEPWETAIAARPNHSPTFSKLQAVALLHYDGNEGLAMDALGIDLTDIDAMVPPGEELPADFGKAAPRGGAEGDSPSPPLVGAPAASDPTAQAVAEAKAGVVASIRAADALFDQTRVLAHIAASADARGSSRVAVLVQVLMRTALAVPPRVVIPAHLGGDHVGLSILVAVTGESSGGKGRAEAVGRDAITLSSHGCVRRFAPMTPSTGEGLVSMFAETEKDDGRIVTRVHAPAALLSFKDIETFGALASRSGNSLVGALLSLYMGDTLGSFTREGARRVMVPAHTVVAALSAGVQPSKGSVLLSPAMRDSGIPQRFLWTPVRNGRRTARSTAPVPLTVELPGFGVSADPYDVEAVFAPDYQLDLSDLVQIDVAQCVTEEIRAADEAKDLDVFGAVPEGQDQLLGHAMLTRVKVALLLAVLHGETAVTAQWWELASLVMAVSEATSNAVAVASGAAEIVAERQVGERIGHRFAASDQVRDDAMVRQVADRLAARVGEDWAAVNSKAVIASKKHGLIGDAWRWLIDNGKVEAREHEWQPGKTTWQYRRARA